MADLGIIKEQLKAYGINTEKELDAALARNLKELDVGIMTSDVGFDTCKTKAV